MRKRIPKILVTGGAGFIGSHFVRLAVDMNYSIVVVDKLTYAGDLKRLEGTANKGPRFYKTDICNKKQIESIFKKERPNIVINFAAETHVDRSILGSEDFLRSNIIGTQVLLEASRKYVLGRYIQISSDEVYGDIEKGAFFEDSTLNPSSPYSATKASADLLIKSYIRTYSLPAVIIRPCNNYGPWQYPEKLIPLAILRALKSEKIPVYARGKNIREWIYVEDCVEAILAVMEKGKTGSIYNLGSGEELENIEVVKLILKELGCAQDQFQFVKDRPGHDIRYRLDSSKLMGETGWRPSVRFEEGIKSTIQWCLDNKSWLLSKGKSGAKNGNRPVKGRFSPFR